MSEKLSLADLVDLLSQKTGKSKKEAEAFLKEFFSLAGSVVSGGESLKINDLGTFKPVWVKPRVSVDVRNGESIEIAGHYKLSFLPDKTLREAVNAPFSGFETVILKEGYTDDTEVDGTDEADGFAGVDDEPLPEENAGEKEKPGSETVVQLNSARNVEAGPHTSEPDVVKDIPEPGTENKEQVVPAPKEEDNILTPEEKKNIRSGRHKMAFLQSVALILLLCCLIMVGSVIYDIYKQQGIFNEFFTDSRDPYLDIIDDVPDVKPAPLESDAVPESQKEILDTVAVVPEKKEEGKADSVPVQIKEDQKTSGSVVKEAEKEKPAVLETGVEEITPGKTLAQLARKYYGNTYFWVYIYIENMSKIPNPNNVAIGTKIVIPDAKKYNINAGSKESVAKAKSIADEVLANFK